MRTLAENIKQQLKIVGISQKDLSETMNVSLHTVWRWVNNERTPDLRTIAKIAEILGVTVSYLTREDDTSDVGDAQPQVSPKPVVIQTQEALPYIKKRGKTYVNGIALDTLACQLRDRMNIELDDNDEKTQHDLKEVLYECMRFLEDSRSKHKTA